MKKWYLLVTMVLQNYKCQTSDAQNDVSLMPSVFPNVIFYNLITVYDLKLNMRRAIHS